MFYELLNACFPKSGHIYTYIVFKWQAFIEGRLQSPPHKPITVHKIKAADLFNCKEVGVSLK